MVREKSETIQELKEAILKILSDEYSSARRERTEKQELRVRGIREVG